MNRDDQDPAPPPIVTPPAPQPPAATTPSPNFNFGTFEEPNSRQTLGRIAGSVLFILVIAIINIARFSRGVEKVREDRNHTKVFYNGRELSKDEIKLASDDMSHIMGPSKKSGETSLDTNYPAKSEIGRAFERLMREQQVIRASNRTTDPDADTKDFLSAAQLGTTSGRAQARAIQKSYLAESNKYWSQVRTWNIHLLEFAHDMSAGAGDASPITTKIDQLARLDNTNSQTIGQLLDLVDKSRPSYNDADKKLVFSGKALEVQYDRLHTSIAANDKALNKLQDELVDSQEAVLDRAFKALAESPVLASKDNP